MSTRQKVCPAPRYQHAQHPHLCHGGDNDRRRAFPPPRRWWQLCITPYFATRGRGDMRGVPNRLTQIAPRRWCGAVLPPWCGVYHLVYHMVVWCNDGLPPPPGWHIWDAVWWSPHVADTPVGEIRGYAQRQPLPGWRKCPPPVIVPAGGGGADAALRPAVRRWGALWLHRRKATRWRA